MNPASPVLERFSRRDRLTRRQEFEACYAEGVRVPGRYLQIYARRNGERRARLGLSVSRRTGSSVVRNGLRRRIREIFRRARSRLLPEGGFDLLVSVRQNAAEASFELLREDFWKALSKAVGRR